MAESDLRHMLFVKSAQTSEISITREMSSPVRSKVSRIFLVSNSAVITDSSNVNAVPFWCRNPAARGL